MLENNSILITGGTGSFGKAFTAELLRRYPKIKRVVLFSRDELKQFEMAQVFSPTKYPQIRFFIGDVRDANRLRSAFEGIDIVVHAAALKQVPTAEYNPFECIKTNVMGAQNIIEAAFATGVKKIVALSTDKAAAPINLYGATKLCSDKLFVASNNIHGKHDYTASVVRYGNVMGSRGSVIPFFLERKKTGVLPITSPDMTRFNISLREGVEMVFHAIEHALGGEIFVPKIPSYRIMDVAEAIAPEADKPIVGIRAGEKIHEEMVTDTDSYQTIETAHHYIIAPNLADQPRDEVFEKYCNHHHGKPVPAGFAYSSGKNNDWLTAEQIRDLIVEHVDADFTV